MALTLAPGTTSIATIVAAVRQIIAGRSNAVGSVTLRTSQTTTVVAAPNCAAGSHPFLFQRTANAAAEVGNGTLYVSAVANEQFTITHASNAQADRTFGYVCLG